MEGNKWFIPMIIFVLLIICILDSTTKHPFHHITSLQSDQDSSIFVESKLNTSPTRPNTTIPRLAYLISGSRSDGEAIKRTLKALYHPLNQYVLHLDLETSDKERNELVKFVKSEPLFVKIGNVRVIERSNLVTYRGPTMVSNTLHAAAILVKEGGEWDWFINLSASDYPLVTQDDLLHSLRTIPRYLNFLEHTSDLDWKEEYRAKPVIIDPGLYSLNKSDVFFVEPQRSLPTAFKLFTGSAWMMLSRPFMEYILSGWDSLPRTLLMYYTNFLSTPEGYFHTVICNVQEFINTTINHDLHFIAWDNPPKQHPHYLTVDDYKEMVDSNAPFARKFGKNEPVLDKIDLELLGRKADGFIPGSWFGDANATISDYSLRPGPGAQRLTSLISGFLSDKDFDKKHCL
ncbi:beta-glucuronosyltransferase GlcAT14B-like [Lycium ferocissimum]|uniref:beta-glucuronosyltransferase GlcAT14B-like n=1 Tax=Lycium ferocissimum TaxID=112874 RepID=UPI0028158D19|nr:beta-glucuronosyltransferase GlcAT14B-like [Lycium ferocissimum]